MEKVFLGLGGNRGDSPRILRETASILGSFLSDSRLSSLFRSEPRYRVDQDDFVNAVFSGFTELSPRELLDKIHEIESSFGRDRSQELSKGPRTLDIDILLFGVRICDDADLTLPHKGLKERKFALIPLLELEPKLCDPQSGMSYSTILASLAPQGIYLLEPGLYDHLYI